MHVTYEHSREIIRTGADDAVAAANRAGVEGWELVSVTETPLQIVMWFKRTGIADESIAAEPAVGPIAAEPAVVAEPGPVA